MLGCLGVLARILDVGGKCEGAAEDVAASSQDAGVRCLGVFLDVGRGPPDRYMRNIARQNDHTDPTWFPLLPNPYFQGLNGIYNHCIATI